MLQLPVHNHINTVTLEKLIIFTECVFVWVHGAARQINRFRSFYAIGLSASILFPINLEKKKYSPIICNAFKKDPL